MNEYRNNMSIIGAGPVGSLAALLACAIFPDKPIILLEKRDQDGRKHGLDIWRTTVNEVISKIEEVRSKVKKDPNYPNRDIILNRTDKVKKYLNKILKKNGVLSSFIATNKLSEDLISKAKEIALDNFRLCNGKEYEVTEEVLKQTSGDLPFPASDQMTELQKILHNSSVVIGADGAHSQVRHHIFDEVDIDQAYKMKMQYAADDHADSNASISDEDLKKFAESQGKKNLKTETMQYLIEIKYSLDAHKRSTWEKIKLNLNNYLLKPFQNGFIQILTENKKVGTLHILVNKEQFDALRSKSNESGRLGTLQNPFTSTDDISNEDVKVMIENQMEMLGNVKIMGISTIPMNIYKANELVKVKNNKIICLAGDAAAGLIFIRGVNNGLKTSANLVGALFDVFSKGKLENINELPDELKQFEKSEFSRVDWKMLGIRIEVEFIKGFCAVISFFHKIGKWIKGIFSGDSKSPSSPPGINGEVRLKIAKQQDSVEQSVTQNKVNSNEPSLINEKPSDKLQRF